MTESVTAIWRAFCDDVREAGLAVLEARPDLAERDRLDGLRYLSNQLADALRSQVSIPRAEGPFLYRFSDELSPHGLPNADNNYLVSVIDPAGTYRLRGNTAGRELIITLGAGHFPTWDYREVAEVQSADLAVDPDGWFEVLIGPDAPHLRSTPETGMVLIRDYLVDWDADPGFFELERLDTTTAVPPERATFELPERLRRAAVFFTESTPLWPDYVERFRTGKANEFSEPGGVSLGSQAILGYSTAWLRLGSGETLVVELDPPPDVYWSIQLYNRWGALPAAGVAQTSVNVSHAVRDPDGRVRVVLAAEDPGITNWVDTLGHEDALVWLRAKPWNAFPAPRATVVAAARLHETLPDTPRCMPEERRESLARRERAMSRRYRR